MLKVVLLGKVETLLADGALGADDLGLGNHWLPPVSAPRLWEEQGDETGLAEAVGILSPQSSIVVLQVREVHQTVQRAGGGHFAPLHLLLDEEVRHANTKSSIREST